ncbi:MAG TPA: hypothetical protein VGO93_01435 [Candidatus Xenobia bacterium]|jgi:hypothetical protein
MKRIFGVLAIGAALAAASIPACAQPGGNGSVSAQASQTSTPFEFRVGVSWANGPDIQNDGKITAGVEYDFSNPVNGGGTLSVSADWIQVDYFVPVVTPTFIFAGTQTESTVPVLLNYKFYSSGPTSRFFGGVGVGAFLGNFGGFGYTGFVGYQFSHNWDVNVRYLGDAGSATSGFARLNNVWSANVGVRF